MRWMWIDRVLSLEPGKRLVAVKNVSLAEEHLHDHFPKDDARGLAACPVMPASLMIEGMAQTAGVLVGHATKFQEKVVLAKVSRAEIEADPTPGRTIRYTAEIERMDATGASTKGVIDLLEPFTDAPARTIGRVDLMFAFLDRNLAGLDFPEHNFVFGEGFQTLLRTSGVAEP